MVWTLQVEKLKTYSLRPQSDSCDTTCGLLFYLFFVLFWVKVFPQEWIRKMCRSILCEMNALWANLMMETRISNWVNFMSVYQVDTFLMLTFRIYFQFNSTIQYSFDANNFNNWNRYAIPMKLSALWPQVKVVVYVTLLLAKNYCTISKKKSMQHSYYSGNLYEQVQSVKSLSKYNWNGFIIF